MSLSEELQKRIDQRPDQWTLGWWDQRFNELQKGYRGATHAVNCSLAESEGIRNSIKDICDRLSALEQKQSEDRAKIGELQARVERMAQFLSKMKGLNGTEAPKKTT